MYDVISPDGFAISATETWKTREEAEEALNKWIKRYRTQGYYSMSNREKLPYDSIYNSCSIIELENELNNDKKRKLDQFMNNGLI